MPSRSHPLAGTPLSVQSTHHAVVDQGVADRLRSSEIVTEQVVPARSQEYPAFRNPCTLM
ncbi:hypothetical protein JNUCC0626_14150 [Lentzea sp. JNUCC 0626]|uniref:hypothetical protein n=1 Tax=Lentzea sp. JNUCC 0626 TaxID=3367513 RepID=UPI003749981F